MATTLRPSIDRLDCRDRRISRRRPPALRRVINPLVDVERTDFGREHIAEPLGGGRQVPNVPLVGDLFALAPAHQ